MRACPAAAGAAGRASRAPGTRESRTARPARSRASGPGSSERELVAHGEQAGGLEPDHRQAAGERGQGAARFGAGALDQAGGEIGAAAAERARARARQDGAVAGGAQHADGGAQVLGLEPAVERVGEEQHVAARRRARRIGLVVAEGRAVPARQRPVGAGRARDARGGAARGCGCADWRAPATRARKGARRGSSATRRSRRERPCRAARAASTSIFIFAMSTPVGHSRRQPLQETQSFIASSTSSEAIASAPSWPVSARRSVLARPRVRCFSSRVTR